MEQPLNLGRRESVRASAWLSDGCKDAECRINRLASSVLLTDKIYAIGSVINVWEYNNAMLSTSRLYKKSLVSVGDSVAYGYGSDGVSYSDIISENKNMHHTKKAISGATFVVRDGREDSILEQIESITGDADYILIEGGFNDKFSGISIGTITQGTKNITHPRNTTIGALENICIWLHENYPFAKVLFIITHKQVLSSGAIDAEIEPYYQAIRDVCDKYAYDYVDLSRKSGLYTYDNVRETCFNGDGIHPNRRGYETFYVPRIEAQMEML